MKGDVISSVELVLPDNVVDACYHLKHQVKACFRALNSQENTGSEITLQRLEDNSVKINVTVLSVDVETVSKEDFKEYCEYRIESTTSTDNDEGEEVIQKPKRSSSEKISSRKRLKTDCRPEVNNGRDEEEFCERELERLADIAEKLRPEEELWKKPDDKSSKGDVYNFDACLPQKKRLAKAFTESEVSETACFKADKDEQGSKETQIWTNDTEILKTLINESTLTEDEKLQLKKVVLNCSSVKLSASTDNNEAKGLELKEQEEEGKSDLPPITTFTNAEGKKFKFIPTGRIRNEPTITRRGRGRGRGRRRYAREDIVIHCRYCDATVRDYSYLFRHVKNIHGEEDDVNDYISEIRPLMRVPCPICKVLVSSSSNMAAHIKQKHEQNERVTCDICQKSYKTDISLRQHVRQCHSSDRKYECSGCSATFTERRSLREHINCVHDTTEVFQCDECGKDFLTKGRLRRHKFIHGEHREFCSYCGKGFHLRDNMLKHIEIVHERKQGKRFQCEYCSKRFTVKGNMMQHMLGVHLRKFPYYCSVCYGGFRRKKEAVAHLEEEHGKEYEEVAVISGSTGNAQQFLISNPGFTGEEDDVQFVAKPRIGKKPGVRSKEDGQIDQEELLQDEKDEEEEEDDDDEEEEEEDDEEEEDEEGQLNNHMPNKEADNDKCDDFLEEKTNNEEQVNEKESVASILAQMSS